MIGKFLHWIGFDREPAQPPSGARPPGNSHRRLVVEPIEDRLLLSAASAVLVSDGGTVVLNNEYLFGGVTGSVYDGVATAGSRGSWNVPAILSTAEVCGVSRELGTADGQTIFSGTYKLQSASSPEELTQEDLAPTPSDRGMVDIAQVARQQVFTEIGSASEKPDSLESPSGLELAADDLSAIASTARADVSHNGPNSLVGTRGRLAAFDLAMQPETSDWRANLKGPGVETPADNLLVPMNGARSPRSTPAVTPAAFSSLRQESAVDSTETSEVILRLAPSDESFGLSPSCRATLARSDDTKLLELAHAERAMGTQVESDGGERISVPAVYLDQRREKPVAHLAIAVGIGQAVMGTRRQAADETEHEQLPPRRRSHA